MHKNLLKATQIIALVCLIFSGVSLWGQTPVNTPAQSNTSTPPPVSSTGVLPKISTPKVIGITPVYNDSIQAKAADAEGKTLAVYPGNILRFTIDNPAQFLNSRPSDKSKVVLYVNGVEMNGITSNWMNQWTRLQLNGRQIPNLESKANIYITLRRNETTEASWGYFYSNANKFYDNYAYLDASIGWEGMSALPKTSTVPEVTVVFFKQIVFLVWVALFAVLLGLFVYVSFFTNALRDGGTDRAYSLSLTQLLFWTTIVIGAFIYCVVLTDILTSFNPSILLLLGISAGTTGIAYNIDTNFAKENPNSPQKQHKTFLKDILSDGKGYSVQRIQIFAWNLVLGVYFISYTITNKSVPEFSTTLLFLAGISSASYLSAKGPENTNANRPIAAAGDKQNQ